MVPISFISLLSLVLASSQPLGSEHERTHYLSMTAMSPSNPDVKALIEEHPALTSETRQFLECSTAIKQTGLVLEKQDPIVADLMKAVEKTNERLDHVVTTRNIDRSVYDFPTDSSEVKENAKKIRPDSAFGKLTLNSLIDWGRLAKAIYYGGYERQLEVAAAYKDAWVGAFLNNSRLFPRVRPTELQSYIAQLAPAFADYMIVKTVTRHATNQHSAAILFNEEKKHLVIAFVGTQTWTDWTYNLSGLKASSQFTKGFSGLNVHSGFYNLVHEQFAEIVKAVKEVVKTLSSDDILQNSLRVSTTGHSLGGAMSTLMAYVLKTKVLSDMGMKNCVVDNYSFASPRVFDKKSAKKVNTALGFDNIVRTYNHSDIVPFLPCEFMGAALDSVIYYHVGVPVKVISPSYGGPLYHHGMGEYVERIAEQGPKFFKAMDAFKLECKKLVIYNDQLASMRAMKQDFEDSQKVCWNLARDHGDRIEQDLYVESSAIKNARSTFDLILNKLASFKDIGKNLLKTKAKAQKGTTLLQAYGHKVSSAKKLIKNLQKKAMRPAGRFKKTALKTVNKAAHAVAAL